ncbi:hypothetical protein [Actinomadura rudentiformis]|uniref:Uncharacterized protein n=1 Tax=Actinomadura rudentiformis TaxID=359158 RepID=A0A6H9YV99_9ACTN|nr:hypothetical protein [Actinomadura rudentiformis]KAB2351009.1 hypothetical protein F8566_08680 [Actinomadura rudentiformis]
MDVPPPSETAEAVTPEYAQTEDPFRALIEGIELQFPGWGAWRSDTDRWWAFRTAANPLTIEELRAGRRLIVQADTVDELRAAIRAEIELDTSDSAPVGGSSRAKSHERPR